MSVVDVAKWSDLNGQMHIPLWGYLLLLLLRSSNSNVAIHRPREVTTEVPSQIFSNTYYYCIHMKSIL